MTPTQAMSSSTLQWPRTRAFVPSIIASNDQTCNLPSPWGSRRKTEQCSSHIVLVKSGTPDQQSSIRRLFTRIHATSRPSRTFVAAFVPSKSKPGDRHAKAQRRFRQMLKGTGLGDERFVTSRCPPTKIQAVKVYCTNNTNLSSLPALPSAVHGYSNDTAPRR